MQWDSALGMRMLSPVCGSGVLSPVGSGKFSVVWAEWCVHRDTRCNPWSREQAQKSWKTS